MIKIVYFAKTREQVGKGEEMLELKEGGQSVQSVVAQLCARGAPYTLAFEDERILAAINQEMVPMTAIVNEGDELAFFPPVTGG